MAKTERVVDFYRLWSSEIDKRLAGYIYDEEGRLTPTRYIFAHYLDILEKFAGGGLEEIEKVNLLSGIRGVGKTTVLAQLYYAPKFIHPSRKRDYGHILAQNYDKIYLEVDHLVNEGITLNEFFNYYQEMNNVRFVDLNRKLLILLDEIHYDEKWGLFLKKLFDVTKGHKNILVIATGSSALKIKLNPDLSRRSLLKELYPLKFNEYVILKYGVFPPSGLSDDLIEAILKSGNAIELFSFFKDKQNDIYRYFSEIPPNAENEYLDLGGLPFVLKSKDRARVFELIAGVIDKLIVADLLEMNRFSSETIGKIKKLLYLIASSDNTDIDKLCTTLNMNYRTVRGVLDTLVQAGVLVEIKSYGRKFVRKPAKFLFISPSLRVSIHKGILPSEVRGKVLEDYLALIFIKDFLEKAQNYGGIEIMHDSSWGGADFILRVGGEKKIVVEVGFGAKQAGISQIENTGRKIGGYDYGIVVGQKADLELVNERVIKMPLKFWLAM